MLDWPASLALKAHYGMPRRRSFRTDAFQAYFKSAGGCRCGLQQVMPDEIQLHQSDTGVLMKQAVT